MKKFLIKPFIFIKDIIKSYSLPLNTIKNKPLFFLNWLGALTLFGLLPLWFSLFDGYMENSLFCAWSKYLHSKALITFSIVLLANGLASLALAKKSGLTDETVVVRSSVNNLCIFLLLVNAWFLSSSPSFDVHDKKNSIQLILFILSFLLSIYLYCFKDSQWEESADVVREKDDKATKKLDQEASNVSVDKNGVRV